MFVVSPVGAVQGISVSGGGEPRPGEAEPAGGRTPSEPDSGGVGELQEGCDGAAAQPQRRHEGEGRSEPVQRSAERSAAQRGDGEDQVGEWRQVCLQREGCVFLNVCVCVCVSVKRQCEEKEQRLAVLEENLSSSQKEVTELRSCLREVERSRLEARRELQELRRQVRRSPS